MAPTVQLIGLKEANLALRKLPEFARVQIQGTADVTAFQVARRASAAAPRGDTGNLQDSIRSESRPRSTSAVVGVDRDAYYWKFHEFGTVMMPARPFMRPAADAVRPDHDRRMLQALEKAAAQTARAQGPVI